MRTVLLISALSLVACGGSGGDSTNINSTTVNHCPDGAAEVDNSQLSEIVDEAVANEVAVEDHSEDVVPVLDQGATLKDQTIIAACGSSVTIDNSQDNDVVNQVKRALRSGQVSKLEIYRGD